MTRLMACLFGLCLFTPQAFGALAATTVWEGNASATANNVNGGSFNPSNAGMLTNFAATSATGNSPVVSSASYNFVAGDVGHWFYVQSGTNWTSGWYQIASVAANAATLSAAVGEAIQVTSGIYAVNTVAGCATTASPTSGTGTMDYSQGTAAILALTDFASVDASAVLTTATGGFTPVMVGNIFHLASGTNATAGWYELTVYTDGNTMTIDRDCAGAANLSSGVGKVGGALSFNSTLDDDVFESLVAGNTVWVKNGAYTLGEQITMAADCTAAAPCNLNGYNATRGDNPVGSTRPTIALGTTIFTLAGDYVNIGWLSLSGTGTSVIQAGIGSTLRYAKVTNSSATVDRYAFVMAGASSSHFTTEGVSQNGTAIQISAGKARIIGAYLHDSNKGLSVTNPQDAIFITDSLFEGNRTTGIETVSTAGALTVVGNTVYGTQAKQGIGISLNNATCINSRLYNNIIYGHATGVAVSTAAQESNAGDYNDYYNNTADVSLFTKGPNDLALDPQFVGASQITGTTATTSGSVLTQAGGDFSTITDNTDYLHVLSGTGVTTGGYLITSHGATTLTVNNALGTSSAGDVTYYVTVGHNFEIGTNLQAQGYPGLYSGSETTSYLDTGAVQRQEAGGSAAGGWGF